ncbi:MAG: hypothetical protein ABI054_11695, partial [Planctomycetota bacterium]
MFKHVLPFAVLASLSLSTSAQSSGAASAIQAWQEGQGSAWTTELDPRSGFVRSIYGWHTDPGQHLYDDRAALARARAHIAATSAMTGIDPATLADDYAMYLPLSNAGSNDKYCANFRQFVRGLPVIAATVNVLMDTEGRALSIDSNAIPNVAVSTTPIREAATATSQALRLFASIAGHPGTLDGSARLVIDRVSEGGAMRAVLAWEVDVYGDGANGLPRGLRLRIADVDLALTSQEEMVHTCDVTGTVFSRLTPGTLPDVASNPTVQLPMGHVQILSPQGNAITDINGNFNIVGATAPVSITVSYNGPFTTPTNAAAPVYVLPANLASPTGNQVIMNSPAAPLYTAEANSTYWIGRLRDWVRAVNPLDAHADFDALSNINLAQTCNAYFNGNSVNFFQAGGGCANTSYSSVVVHEMGHWLNVLYSSNNGSDGFGEGNADNYGTYVTDQPIIGELFYNNGNFIRSGLNSTQFCGDLAGGCHGEVHADGEVLMGAMWKLRARLKTTLGNSAGAATADLLFSSWMNVYDDTQIKTIVRTHWLTLDDNDGYLGNGTPHFGDINGGFVDQGFPPYVLIPVLLTNVTQLGNTTNEVGPYQVNAHIVANLAPPLQTPEFFWRINGGSFNSVPMTALGNDNFSASIPGQISPTKVEYYIRAFDSLGGVGFAPPGAPATTIRFIVGEERVYYSDNFDLTTSNWTSVIVNGTNDWQFATPNGKAGDPIGPKSGSKCWGTDLGNSSFDGLYSANSSTYLESPAINLLNCPRPILRFQRWLTVESALHDQARVVVNGQVIWTNSNAADHVDLGWTEFEFDLSAIAAGTPNTKIRFELTTDGVVQKGGWNIDDVQIVTTSAVGLGCVDPIPYCNSKMTSLGTTPSLNSLGSNSATLQSLRIELIEATLSKPGILLRSTAGQASVPFSGGTLCIQQPIVRYATFTT